MIAMSATTTVRRSDAVFALWFGETDDTEIDDGWVTGGIGAGYGSAIVDANTGGVGRGTGGSFIWSRSPGPRIAAIG